MNSRDACEPRLGLLARPNHIVRCRGQICVQRIIVNMERWRWMPEDMGEFYVWNNIPEFQSRVVKRGHTIH